LTDLAGLHKQAEAARQTSVDTGNEAALLAALRMPPEVPGLSDQISAAQLLVATGRQRREEAEQLAEAARQTRAQLPDKATTQQQLAMYALRRELTAEAEAQQLALQSCRAAEQHAAAELKAAGEALNQAQDALAAARRAHAAADLAVTLHAGDDCPVCRQRILTMPALEAPADLDAADAAVGAATTAQRKAQAAHQKAASATAAASTPLANTHPRLAESP